MSCPYLTLIHYWQFMYGSVENMARMRPVRLIVTNRKPNQDTLQARGSGGGGWGGSKRQGPESPLGQSESIACIVLASPVTKRTCTS